MAPGRQTGSDIILPPQKECSDGGDSSALSGQTLLCSGIVFALESEVLGSNLGAGTDLALGTTIGDEDVEKESMLQFICVDTYFITDYGVFCGINVGLFKRNRIVYRPQHCGRWNHPTQVSSLQKGEECSDGVVDKKVPTSNFRSIEVCRYTSCPCVFNVKSAGSFLLMRTTFFPLLIELATWSLVFSLDS